MNEPSRNFIVGLFSFIGEFLGLMTKGITAGWKSAK